MWSDILNKFDNKYPEFLAQQCAFKARSCILTSTNWDGSPMVTRKKHGKPLIDTGYMVGAISSVGNSCISPAPYSQTVQDNTGNTFLPRPSSSDIRDWTELYLKK